MFDGEIEEANDLQVIAPDGQVLVTRRAVQTKLLECSQLEGPDEADTAPPPEEAAAPITNGPPKKKRIFICKICGAQ
eukprot:4602908-Prymnesium_polylepis.1